MFIKIDENGFILGHMSVATVGYDVEIADQYLITFIEKEWAYKFKYVEGALIELTEQEIVAQPQYLVNIREQAIQQQLKNIEFGKRLIAIIGVMLDEKEYTNEQTALVNSTFSNIVTLLQTGSLLTSKDAITAITPSELVTQDDKDAVLAELNAYLGV